MSDLVTRAEIIKLAATLEAAPSQLRFLEPLSAGHLHTLRLHLSDVLFDARRSRLQRLATIARFTPVALIAWLAERVFRAEIAAPLIGLIPVDKAVKVAVRMPIMFLADAAVEMDPRRVSQLMTRLPTQTMVDVANELVERGDLVTVGRFLDAAPDEALVAALDKIQNDDAIVRALLYTDAPQDLDRVVDLIPPDRLRALVHAGLVGGPELHIAVLFMLSRVSDALKKRLGDLAADESDELLSGLLNTAVRENAVPELLMGIEQLSPPSHAKVARISALADQRILDDLIHTTAVLDYWNATVPVLDQMEPGLQGRVMQVVQGLDADTLRRLARCASADDLWPAVLGLLARQDPATQERIAAPWQTLEATELAAVQAQASKLGLEDALSPALGTLARQPRPGSEEDAPSAAPMAEAMADPPDPPDPEDDPDQAR